MKQFVFMYPIPEFIDFEIGLGCYGFKNDFREFYKKKLNSCINKRYRQNNFKINYFIFDDSKVSDIILLQDSDKVKSVSLDYKKHLREKEYPNEDYILSQLDEVDTLRICGFHMWDCVERIAKRAYEKGIETLVDEDLTEFFTNRIKDRDFQEDKYPTYSPHKNLILLGQFIETRKNKPWLWQEY
jgi:hypothetical protein